MQDEPACLVLATVDADGTLRLDRQAPARIHLRPGQTIEVTLLYHQQGSGAVRPVRYVLDCALGGLRRHDEARRWSVPFVHDDVEGSLVAHLPVGAGGLLDYRVEAASGAKVERLAGQVRIEMEN